MTALLIALALVVCVGAHILGGWLADWMIDD